MIDNSRIENVHGDSCHVFPLLAVGKKTASKAKKASKESVGTQNKKSDDAKKSAKKETAVEKDTKSA